jgi:hypothetical protein
MHALFALRFPSLRSLALTSVLDTGYSCPHGFIAFLTAHHTTIEDLHLGWNRVGSLSTGAALAFDSSDVLHPDFLPNLQVFRGDLRNVELMARARMRCLTTLRELTIGSTSRGAEPIVDDIRRMLGAIEATGRLDALQQLDFELFEWRDIDYDFWPEFVQRLGALCGPTLEVWRGLLPFGGSSPLDALAFFPRLQTIRFPHDSTVTALTLALSLGQTYASTDVLKGVQSLAEICKELKEVIAEHEQAEDVCWKIDRHLELGIVKPRCLGFVSSQ